MSTFKRMEDRVKSEPNIKKELKRELIVETSLCRACLSATELINIFSEEHAVHFTECTTIPVHPDDGLPPYICISCHYNLKQFYNFKQLCLRSATALRYNIVKIPKVEIGKIESLSCDNNDDDIFESKDGILEEYINNNETRYFNKSNEINSSDNLVSNMNKLNQVSYTNNITEENLSEVCEVPIDFSFTNVEKMDSTNDKKNINDAPCICDVCGKTLKGKSSLKVHMKSHDKRTVVSDEVDLKKTFICEFCGNTFGRKNHLTQHLLRHQGIRNYPCKKCSASFYTHFHLSRHNRTHTKAPKKWHTCKTCWISFLSENDLLKHKPVHTTQEINERSCNICKKSFTTKSFFKEHMKKHIDNHPCVCKLCLEKFINRKHLREHMIVHTGEKPFNCKYCEEKFSKAKELHIHQKNNHKALLKEDKRKRNSTTFICDYCDGKFSRKYHLKQHILRHQGIKKFPCEVCSSSFYTKFHLSRHMLMHTRDNQNSQKLK